MKIPKLFIVFPAVWLWMSAGCCLFDPNSPTCNQCIKTFALSGQYTFPTGVGASANFTIGCCPTKQQQDEAEEARQYVLQRLQDAKDGKITFDEYNTEQQAVANSLTGVILVCQAIENPQPGSTPTPTGTPSATGSPATVGSTKPKPVSTPKPKPVSPKLAQASQSLRDILASPSASTADKLTAKTTLHTMEVFQPAVTKAPSTNPPKYRPTQADLDLAWQRLRETLDTLPR
jgi:hypothetical protein